MDIIETDCLVIGAGLAGSAYALHAAKAGLAVELLSAADPLNANSDLAQGGIVYETAADPSGLARDIFEASDRTANPAATRGASYSVLPACTHVVPSGNPRTWPPSPSLEPCRAAWAPLGAPFATEQRTGWSMPMNGCAARTT